MVPPAPTIHFIPLIQFRVTVGLEPIPAVTGREVGTQLTEPQSLSCAVSIS